jgi:hypothetical protein
MWAAAPGSEALTTVRPGGTTGGGAAAATRRTRQTTTGWAAAAGGLACTWRARTLEGNHRHATGIGHRWPTAGHAWTRNGHATG